MRPLPLRAAVVASAAACCAARRHGGGGGGHHPLAADPGWAQVPIRSAALAERALGGEGCQVVRALGVSPVDPSFMLLGADVGGVHRSLTEGDHWHPAMVGWHSRGASAFAFDPVNADHVLAAGGNSNPFPGANGVHVSFDRAASWQLVLPVADAFGCLDGSALVLDPTSVRNATAGEMIRSTGGGAGSGAGSGGGSGDGSGSNGSSDSRHSSGAGAISTTLSATAMAQTAFYSASTGLWRSDDAGRNWTLVDAAVSNACLVVDKAGRLFAASSDVDSAGLYACGSSTSTSTSTSTGAGLTCTLLRHENTTGLGLGPDGETLFMSSATGVLVSQDHGATFASLPGAGLPTSSSFSSSSSSPSSAASAVPIHQVAVSPANASHVAVWWSVGPWYNVTQAVSHDGGASFVPVAFDNSNAFMPMNARAGTPLWHPTNASVLFSAGGDWPTRSTDAGRTLAWAADGYAVVMVGGGFAFNTHAPDVLLLAFQDYAGAFTRDAGDTWEWVGGAAGMSGEAWGGMGYGGYALSEDVMWAGDAPSWKGPRTLRVTRDGGRTWATVDSLSSGSNGGRGGDSSASTQQRGQQQQQQQQQQPAVFAGPDVSSGDPADALVGFASNWRTADGGATWAPMVGCAGVLATWLNTTTTAAAVGGSVHTRSNRSVLFGVSPNRTAVVRSEDSGVSWTTLFAVPGRVELGESNRSGTPGRGDNSSSSGKSSSSSSNNNGSSRSSSSSRDGNGASDARTVQDIAFDWSTGALYVVAGVHGSQGADMNGLFHCTEAASASLSSSSSSLSSWSCEVITARLPADQGGGARVTSVAVDAAADPSVVYAATARDVFLADNAVVRSTDGGLSFAEMVRSEPLQAGPLAPLQGPHEAGWLRVHPVTRWLWVATGCFGVWKAPPP